MQAVIIAAARELEVREVPTPAADLSSHLLLDIDSAAINHGDKTFEDADCHHRSEHQQHDIWDASAAGRVLSVGAGVSLVERLRFTVR